MRGPEALTLAGLADSTLVSERTRVFPADFNRRVDLQPQGSEAFFGLDVLDGLVSGIADFVALRQPRWARYRSVGPALLASTLWLDDPKVIAHLGSLSSACVVITKQPRPKAARDKLAALRECNKNAPGFPARAFSALTELAPLVDGRPQVIGPMSAMPDLIIPTVRTLGFRKAATGDSPPLLHAKLALLGHLWWHDEDGAGGVADVLGFEPKRLWVSSANFTESSRRSLEFGFWTEDSQLMRATQGFLVDVMACSEDLDPDSDVFTPDHAPVDYDDQEFIEYLNAVGWPENDDEE